MSMLVFAAAVHGQGSTTAALSGRVVSGDSSVSGAEVLLTFVPTNTSYTTTTDSSGRYALGGLRVGGPYSLLVSSRGHRSTIEDGIVLSLSQTLRIVTNLDSSDDVIELEPFEVNARPATIFDSDRFGSGSVIAGEAIQITPSINENIADIVRLNPLIAIMDPERLEINAAGQHFRQNSVQVDGVNLNDQFGLEATGFPPLLNPFPIRTIEQFSVSVSPYDVRSSGFTGALINAVTKSGTNEFEGELYYLYSDDSLRADNFSTGASPAYESNTYGISLGGPILKDKLFFFVNYEKAEIEREASSPGFIPDAAEVQRLRDYLTTLSTTAYPTGYDPGGWGSAGALTQEDEKILAKLDWVINDQHRLTVRYSETEATEPLFGEYDDFGETSLESHYYTNAFESTAFATQLNSRWNDVVETEFSVARDTFDKAPTYNDPNLFPQIIIDKFPGTSADGSSSTNAELFFGSEDSRQANELATKTLKGKGAATIYLGKHTIVTGFDYEKTEFENLFLQDVYGDIEFETLQQIIDDDIIRQSFSSPNPFMARKTGVAGESIAAGSDYTGIGLFVQDTWQVNSRLELLFGIRKDEFSTNQTPAANNTFNSTFTTQSGLTGFDNTNTIDGKDQFSVRAGFKLDLDSEERQQFRGGIGLFQGRVPGVYLSNAFSNNGATTSVIDYETGAYDNRGFESDGTTVIRGITLTEYLNNEFDPSSPIIEVASPSGSQVDLIDRAFELPSVWKANVAYDIEIPSTNLTFTIEALQTWTNKGIYVENLNLSPIDTTPDGRAYYDGDNWFNGNYGEVYNLRNTDKGEATNVSFALTRPMINNWSFSASYTYGESSDVSSVTSSTAGSNYGNRAIFNGNEEVESRSNYETRHRILVQYAYQKQWNDRNKSIFSMVYEGRSGRPYSYVFDGDYNNDDRSGNDLFYVPSSANDSRVTLNGSATEIADFFAYIDSQEGLREYRGSTVDRNSGVSDWIDRVDIRLAHSFMVTERVEFELWVSVQNFLNLLNDDWGHTVEVPFSFTSEVAFAEYDSATNKIEYDLTADPQNPQIDNDRNYAISIGGALKF